jgi:hypothetical protein
MSRGSIVFSWVLQKEIMEVYPAIITNEMSPMIFLLIVVRIFDNPLLGVVSDYVAVAGDLQIGEIK